MIFASSTQVLPSPPHFRNSDGRQITPPSCVRFRPPFVTVAAYASAERTKSSTCVAPSKLASSCSFYEVLGIPMGASSNEIKAAYRRRARVCHPDVAAVDRKESCTDEFMKVHAAYSTLSDPEKRADYDRRLFQRHRSFASYSGASNTITPVMPRFSGYTPRNWETDQCW